jgi:cyclopropane fatty-acyl-phospholipid synthase-like methyltransferase
MPDHSKESANVFDRMAELYSEKFMDIDLYNDSYDAFRDLLPQNSRILELACGPGNITKYLLSKRNDLKILATDLAPNMVKLTAKNNPDAEVRVLDCRKIDELSEKFRGIICGFLLPYLSKEETQKLISDSRNLLEDNGILYLSAIEGPYSRSGYEKSSNGKEQCYVYYYEEADLTHFLTEERFELTMTFRKPYVKADQSQFTHLICIARKTR